MNIKKRGNAPSINASSMADVAFLLLIFFLVVTTIDVDKGITVKLPPWCEGPDCVTEAPNSQILSIKVNAANQLLVKGTEIEIGALKERTKQYLLEKEKKSIISLQNDRATNYDTYLAVYNELKAAYNEVWEQEAFKQYGEAYERLGTDQKREIRKIYPQVISEAESSDFSFVPAS